MFTKPYHISVGGTSYRVEQDFWNESEENREFIRRRCIYINGDAAWPRSQPLDIAVMDADNLGCVYFEQAHEFKARILGVEPCPTCEGTGLLTIHEHQFDDVCTECEGEGLEEAA